MTNNRRDFIKKLAKGAAYVAPVVITMTAPTDLAGQGKSSQHKHHGQGNSPSPGVTPSSSPFPPPPGR
jgi:hypothetical protein